MFLLSEQVRRGIALLEAAGHEVYLVGGCVRDYYMGIEPKDFDLATSGRAEEVKSVFQNFRVIETGLSHGTVTVLLEGVSLEITTYRSDGAYSDHRHPDKVSFVGSLEEDLKRRDFTMNAMAYHPQRGLVDIFGGREDIAKGIVCCVGQPEERFSEDALRILRGLRFASRLGFSIEEKTSAAMFSKGQLLAEISAERLQQEMTGILCGRAVKDILLSYSDIFGVVIPEILPMVGFLQETPYHIYDVFTHTAVAVSKTAPDGILRWTMLLHDIGKPACFFKDADGIAHFHGHNQLGGEMSREILQRLRFDKETGSRIETLVSVHDVQIPATSSAVKRWLNRLGAEGFFQLIAVKRADNLAQSPKYQERQALCDALEAIAKEVIAAEECFSLRDLEVNGSDLIALGYTGKEIGDRLQNMLELVMDGKVPNQRQVLLGVLGQAVDGATLSEDLE